MFNLTHKKEKPKYFHLKKKIKHSKNIQNFQTNAKKYFAKIRHVNFQIRQFTKKEILKQNLFSQEQKFYR